MFKKYLLAFCCICGAACIANAQKKADTGSVTKKYVKLRINPLAIAEPDAGVMIGAELQLNKRISVGLDLAYLFMEHSGYGSLSGYKIRPEFRYYFVREKKTTWFLAAEAAYKRVAYKSVSNQCAGGPGCPFMQQINYTSIKSVPGGSVKFGFLSYIDRKRRSYIECFLGTGLKVVDRYEKGKKNEPDNNDGPFEGLLPALPAGIKFGIRL